MRCWKIRSRSLVAGVFACFGLLGPAQAQKSADTLRVYWRDQVPDVDPYYNNMRTGLIVAHHIMDGLVYRDPDTLEAKPLLATAWKLIDPTTLEFELRQGVTFHNGDRFTAADVVYTIKTVTDPKSGIVVPSNFNYIAAAEAIDDYHVRLKLKAPFPPALEYLGFVTPIYPAAYRERVGHDGFSKLPVGTGPYKVNRIDGVSLIDLERYDGYFGGIKGVPPIKHLVIHEVNDASTELTSLLGGQSRVDLGVQPRPVRQDRGDPDADRATAQIDAHRAPDDRRGRPLQREQPAEGRAGTARHHLCNRS